MGYSLVAVSGGSDSMALLDILYNKGLNLIVCHVNYGFRNSAIRDENIVRRYCLEKKIKLEILKDIKYDKKEGNFENWARVITYNSLNSLPEETHAHSPLTLQFSSAKTAKNSCSL